MVLGEIQPDYTPLLQWFQSLRASAASLQAWRSCADENESAQASRNFVGLLFAFQAKVVYNKGA